MLFKQSAEIVSIEITNTFCNITNAIAASTPPIVNCCTSGIGWKRQSFM